MQHSFKVGQTVAHSQMPGLWFTIIAIDGDTFEIECWPYFIKCGIDWLS